MINNLHPVSLCVYFLSVLTIVMFIQNPIFTIFSITCSILLYLCLNDFKIDKKAMTWNISLFILISITNPLFSHNGISVLFYLNNNAITLEAILYGVNMALTLLSVLYWFKCINIILTQDKILFLFSKFSPKLALIISNSLRFIPLLKEHTIKVKNAQKTMGIYNDDNYLNRLKSTLRTFSSVTDYGFENAIEMGMSMDARGYGIKGRTYYSNYKFTLNDISLTLLTIILDIIILLAKKNQFINFNFYPTIKISNINTQAIISYLSFIILVFIPTIIVIKENLKWKYYESKI